MTLAILETGPNPSRAEDLYRQLLVINDQDANAHRGIVSSTSVPPQFSTRG